MQEAYSKEQGDMQLGYFWCHSLKHFWCSAGCLPSDGLGYHQPAAAFRKAPEDCISLCAVVCDAPYAAHGAGGNPTECASNYC